MFTLNCKGKLVSIERPLIMGILNITPDSFYAGSRFTGQTAILSQAEKLLTEGADILDIGGQSTRPGAPIVGEEEELRRVIDAVAGIRERFPEAILSIDTWYAGVAGAAVMAGASIVNDISGGNQDSAMLDTVGRLGVPYICMHMKGTQETMNREAKYEDVTREVLDYFIRKTEDCRRAGIQDVILDPGLGFAKTAAHNLQLLRELSVFRMLERPILLGVSRKSVIYKTLGITAEEALNGTTVLNTLGLLNGADILRVHDAREARQAVLLLDAYKKANSR